MEKPGQSIAQQIDQNWSEAVEDLVSAGDSDAAISLLEKLVSQLEALTPSEAVNLQLASALTELAKLYSANNLSLKSDELLSRATLLRHSRTHCNIEAGKKDLNEDDAPQPGRALACSDSVHNGCSMDVGKEESSGVPFDASPCTESSDFDDWEAIADRPPDELLASPDLPSVSNLSLEDSKPCGRKQRGRGTFSYKQEKLYSDRQSDASLKVDTEDEDVGGSVSVQHAESLHSKYGTRHVVVIANFPPSTKTIDLENLFKELKDHVMAIRWVNDTVALAVFQTPSLALEAMNKIRCPFTMRILEEDDILLSSIRPKDLEPPRRRPKTSARTAQRLIAQSMGLKLPSKTFGSKELRNQEEARKNRIVTRQKMIEDAWGADDN